MNRRRESWFFIKMLLSKQDWIDSVFSFVCSPFVTMKIVDFGHLIEKILFFLNAFRHLNQRFYVGVCGDVEKNISFRIYPGNRGSVLCV